MGFVLHVTELNELSDEELFVFVLSCIWRLFKADNLRNPLENIPVPKLNPWKEKFNLYQCTNTQKKNGKMWGEICHVLHNRGPLLLAWDTKESRPTWRNKLTQKWRGKRNWIASRAQPTQLIYNGHVKNISWSFILRIVMFFGSCCFPRVLPVPFLPLMNTDMNMNRTHVRRNGK